MKYVFLTLAFVLTLIARPFAQAAPQTIAGEWDLTTLSPLGENTNTVVISKDGDTWKAVAKSPQGERPYDRIAVADNNITLVLTIDFQGSPMVITYQGTVDGGVMNGACDFGGLADGSWSAKRKDKDDVSPAPASSVR